MIMNTVSIVVLRDGVKRTTEWYERRRHFSKS